MTLIFSTLLKFSLLTHTLSLESVEERNPEVQPNEQSFPVMLFVFVLSPSGNITNCAKYFPLRKCGGCSPYVSGDKNAVLVPLRVSASKGPQLDLFWYLLGYK